MSQEPSRSRLDTTLGHPIVRRWLDGEAEAERALLATFAVDLADWFVGRPLSSTAPLSRVVGAVAERELRDVRALCRDQPLLAVEAAARAVDALWPLLRRPLREARENAEREDAAGGAAGQDGAVKAGSGGASEAGQDAAPSPQASEEGQDGAASGDRRPGGAAGQDGAVKAGSGGASEAGQDAAPSPQASEEGQDGAASGDFRQEGAQGGQDGAVKAGSGGASEAGQDGAPSPQASEEGQDAAATGDARQRGGQGERDGAVKTGSGAQEGQDRAAKAGSGGASEDGSGARAPAPPRPDAGGGPGALTGTGQGTGAGGAVGTQGGSAASTRTSARSAKEAVPEGLEAVLAALDGRSGLAAVAAALAGAEARESVAESAVEGAIEAARVARVLERLVPGLGWTGAAASLQRAALADLERLSALLDRLPELEDLARRLGRAEAGAKEAGEEQGGGEEVTGVHLGGEVSHALPSELALLADEATEDLFYQRMAEHRLVSLELVGEGLYGRSAPKQRGPVIAAIDTSGSMRGAPEATAKALVLAICRKILPKGRQVHLILFGGPQDRVELRLKRGGRGLDELLAFLARSFHAGTDFDAPLLRAAQLLQEEELKRADLLVVTDGLARAAKEVVLAVRATKERLGTRVMAVLLGDADANGVRPFADEVWAVDPERPEALGGVLRQIVVDPKGERR